MDRLIFAGLVVLILVIAADRYWPAQSTAPAVTATAERPAPGSTLAPVPGGSGEDNRLVAVLPFRNRSALAEDAYFSEGIHDDLLTQLSKVSALKVISRTSMMRYADSDQSTPEIARELGAAVVLEGSVQRAGDKVRINVQLIDGLTDVHLWAENYDRELSTENVFAIQADIAQAVAKAMQAVLTPEETQLLVDRGTQSLPAFEAYLRGTLLFGDAGGTRQRLLDVRRQFALAIELDPVFAKAYAGQAMVELEGYWFKLLDDASLERARRSLDRAAQLAPNDVDVLLAEAYFQYWAKLDYAAAEDTLSKILEKAPQHAEALRLRGYVARRDGRFEDAVRALYRAVAIDPIDTSGLSTLADTLQIIGRFDLAEPFLQRAYDAGWTSNAEKVEMRISQGDPEAAWAALGPSGMYQGGNLVPYRAALVSRNPKRIEASLSEAVWPTRLRDQPDYPQAWALAHAQGLLVMGRATEAQAALSDIAAKMSETPTPYADRWNHNSPYWPMLLPGMLGDLEGVRAAERDYETNAPKDLWAARDIWLDFAIAFARAGDLERAMDYLEKVTKAFGVANVARIQIEPGLDAVREQPRYKALQAQYQAWLKRYGPGGPTDLVPAS
jgi:TolB-like protein